MTFGEKLSHLRRRSNYTQEQLADILGVSRQAISKWESDAAFPETDKLIRISKLFDCSLDDLLKNELEPDFNRQKTSPTDTSLFFQRTSHERKSEKTLWGMPLWHIGKQARGVFAVGINAGGVFAIGLKARGVVSIGLFSAGFLSFGTLSLGLFSFGAAALGLLSAGAFSAGILTAGAICLGVVSFGAIAIGDFSIGALSVAKYAAIGDCARAMIALGDTQAVGTLYEKTGTLTPQEALMVRQLLDTAVPHWLAWAKELFQLFL